MNTSAAWEKSFPRGYGHTSVAYLKRCRGYEDAKNGDIRAAEFVVGKCTKEYRLRALREQYSNAVLLPVIGRNALPLALARAIGLPIHENVQLSQEVERKNLFAVQRLIHKPRFHGNIEKDMAYILVDDIITQGGTVAALRKHVIKQGGRVVAVIALAYSVGSQDIAPTEIYLSQLAEKLGESIHILRATGVADSFEELTNSQIKYLLSFSSIHEIERKLRSIRILVPIFPLLVIFASYSV